MIFKPLVLSTVALVMLAAPTQAQKSKDATLGAQEATWTACQERLGREPDNWIGWRRDFGGGYTESFEFSDGRLYAQSSVLEVTRLIDGIAAEYTTWCYDSDGSISTIDIVMVSPDMTQGGEMGPIIERHGRLYYGPEGHLLKVLAWYADSDSKPLGPITDPTHELARGCNLLDQRLSADDVQREYESVLGDIDGKQPDYVANELDWCAVAVEGP